MSHDFNREAGVIDEISVDALGRVVVVATVSDRMAMRLPALSISASIDKFTVRGSERPDFVGEIEAVTDVNEISLTSTPSNRNCLVLERWEPDPIALSYEAVIDRVKRMQQLVVALKDRAA